MNIGLPRRLPCTPGASRQVDVPPDVRALSTLSHVDYADAYVLETGSFPDRTAEQWARATLESAPSTMRQLLLWLLSSVLGLRLGPVQSEGFIVGWEVRRSTAELVCLGAESARVGLSAELVFTCRGQTLLWATFVQHHKATARVVWAGIAPVHRQVVQYLLERASDSI